jgi:uncharacterized protein YaeQ
LQAAVALSATIFKASLQIADLDRNYYQDHALTLARHPSETDERLMVRLLAYALNAADSLEFGRGLSADDEPDLWIRDLTGNIELWIEVGLPDEKTVRKACNRAARVRLYSYGGQASAVWKKQLGSWDRKANLEIFSLDAQATRELAGLAQRSMRLQVTIQDGRALITDGAQAVEITAEAL